VGSLDDGNKSRIISYRDQEKGQIPSRIMVRLIATARRGMTAVRRAAQSKLTYG
jgi:hypothetical protein